MKILHIKNAQSLWIVSYRAKKVIEKKNLCACEYITQHVLQTSSVPTWRVVCHPMCVETGTCERIWMMATRDVVQSENNKAAMNCRNPEYIKAARGAPHSERKRNEFFRRVIWNRAHSSSSRCKCGVRNKSFALGPRTQVRGKNE